jgi:two-component system, cell cycle sensor histidine kinase and response regulator CckA
VAIGHPGTERAGLSAADVAILGEKEALARLDLLSSISRILDATLEDYDDALRQVADTCVPDFADLCAIEVIGPDGDARTAAYRTASTSGLHLPEEWVPIGRNVAPDRRPVLTFGEAGESEAAVRMRERFGAQSLIVAPVTGGGLTLGWFVAATGRYRRGFRPSALRIGAELSSRLGTAIQRVMLHREMQASVRDQSRTVRRLRRLATAATNLAGAATTQSVLDIACVEACVIQEADGAIAKWSMSDGTVVSSQAGQVRPDLAEAAFEAVANRRAGRGRGWVAYPLPSSDPWQQAALVVFVGDDFSTDEELVLSSLASLIPVAFERALGTEAALTHEARLRAVVDTSPIALIGLQKDGTVTMANRAAQELFGWGTDPLTWIVGGSLRPPITDLVNEVLRTAAVVNHPLEIDERDLSLSGAPMPTVSPSDPPSVLIAGVDLSEIRRAERALVQAQRLEAMGQVAGRVAHDFNNLLTLIIGYAELLRRGTADEKQRALVDNIDGASKRAAALTQQMLGMTRQKVDSGVVIDLGREVQDLDAVLAKMAGPKVDLRIRSSRNVIKVRLDPSEMEQIVVNLVINACDAMDGVGTVDVTVEMAVPTTDIRQALELPEGPLALLTIADDGPGMTPEVQAQCLDPFFTTKERGHGSGLGLPTVYGLVKERGGQLRIESTLGSGTAIRIWLPVARDAEITAGDGDADSWPPGRTINGRILLVEDDDDLRRMAEQILRSIGLDLVAARSAEEALDIHAVENRFDALVTDIMLPGLSGVDLVTKIREVEPNIPVLYMTGYTGGLAGTRQANLGDPVLRKPYRPDALRLRVAELIQLRVLQGMRR